MLEIDDKFSFPEEDTNINIPLSEMKIILLQEITDLGGNIGDIKNVLIDNALKYKQHIEQITDYKSFFRKVIFLYTIEGFLYHKMNSFLRNLNQSHFNTIKYYYTSLLASFEFFRLNTYINKNQDLIVYRASHISEEEFEKYFNNNNSNIIRIYKEFLSTSSNPVVPKNYFTKNDSITKEFFWEIKIPKEIIKNESNNFADISQVSLFQDEQEILLRSGAIIQIDKIVPYTEIISNQIIEYKNEFKKFCTVKTFSLDSFFDSIPFDNSIKNIDFSGYGLGRNDENIIYLKDALKKNKSIHTLDLQYNNLGENQKDILNLLEALKKSKTIESLDISNNYLGKNEMNILNLKQALEINNSIKSLNLRENYLGKNEENMLYIKGALKKNKSIQSLDLSYNYLGENVKNIIYLKEALEKNTSILTLVLSHNNLSKNDQNMLILKEALEKNYLIQKIILDE